MGCGYDTTFFWLRETFPDLTANMCYIEVDYDRVVDKKVEVIKQKEDLSKSIDTPASPDSTSDINAANYKLFAHDVRETEQLGKTLVEGY